MERDFLTFEEVQDLLKLSRSKMYQMLQRGELPAYKIGKQWRIEKSELEEWLASKKFNVTSPEESTAMKSRIRFLSLFDLIGEVLNEKGISPVDVPSMIEAMRGKS